MNVGGELWRKEALYEIMDGGNTYLIAPSLVLLRSRNPDNRESGVWRLQNWHSSGAHTRHAPIPPKKKMRLTPHAPRARALPQSQ